MSLPGGAVYPEARHRRWVPILLLLADAADLSRAAGGTMPVRYALFVVGGALAGLAWQRLVGCRTGACPITSSPYISTMYGAAMGYLLAGPR